MRDQPPPKFMPHRIHRPDSPQTEADRFLEVMRQRRTVRAFSDRPVPRRLIETVIAAAGTAPSGANKQPWRFVVVSDPELKRAIREGAEEEERRFYEERANADWLDDLKQFATNPQKPYLETAPWLVVVFKLVKDDARNGLSDQAYYVNESVGIAVGMLLAAAQHAGLATLTHTPSPMGFLTAALDRPSYERPYLLVPMGYPADDCMVPAIQRKSLDEIMVLDRGEPPTPPPGDPLPSSQYPQPSPPDEA